jgi:hypothetical protein
MGSGTRPHCRILARLRRDTVAPWLERHPGIEIVARDRAGLYAGSQGAVNKVLLK